MNPDLQKQLADMLAKLTSAAEQGAQWTAGQIPPLVREKIVVGRIEETAHWVFGFLLLAVVLPRTVRALSANIRGAHDAPWDQDGAFIVRAVMAGIATIVTLVLGCGETLGEFHNFVLVWFAPRLYIVEWLKGMVTK